MNCGHSMEMLALFVEDDLPVADAKRIRDQISACNVCRQACEQLQASQSLIKARLKLPCHEVPNTESLADLRRRVVTRIQAEQPLGWTLKVERALTLSFRRHHYAFASLVICVVVSAALLGQVGRTLPAAQFEGKYTLLRPDRYLEWISVGSGVYVDPAGYAEYEKTGTFPERTVIVLKRTRSDAANDPHGDFSVSVKDSSRFEGGWGFFDLSGKSKAEAASGGTCQPCHREKAQTDHVFTQFYPGLRSATGSQFPISILIRKDPTESAIMSRLLKG
jgi:hypothetical protein